MSVLEKIRRQGFKLAPVDDAGLYIEPIDGLTDIQRQWLTDHKPEIRRQLLAERWHWFLSLAAEHGIHPDVAGAEFPTDQDRLDVVEPAEHDDDRLRKCMSTLCRGFTVRRHQQLFEADRWVPVDLNHYQNLSKG